jgi:aryl-alcohol dehydrogenase-like predicted oxidoreductase
MTSLITLPKTDLQVHPLCLGGNVFGWTADEAQSFAVLDAYFEAGGNFIDTADVYSEWKDGNSGGESETIIGNWMKARGNRDKLVIATKVAKLSTRPGLSSGNIEAALSDSLRRLQTSHIDLYYSHEDDGKTPMEETLNTYTKEIKAGRIRHIGASQHTGARLLEAARVSKTNSFAEYVVLQDQYNLMERNPFESEQAPVVKELGISALPFFGLARGFLSGKYRPGVKVDSVRAQGNVEYETERGWKVIETLDAIAKSHDAPIAAIALGYLRANDAVSTPIASARTVEQLHEIMQIVSLSSSDVSALNEASN